MISAILLAAGESRRMGRPKQLLEWQGRPLLLHVLENCVRSSVDEVILVLGHEAHQIRSCLPELPVKIVVNPDYETGMASSLRQGLLSMDARSEAFLVLLADQPCIGPDMIDRVIREFRQAHPRRGIVRPVHKGVPGHPVLIGVEYLQEALELHGDQGARRILMDHPADVLEIGVDREGVLMDVDTREGYRACLKRAELDES